LSVLYPSEWPRDGRGHAVPLCCWSCQGRLDPERPCVEWAGPEGERVTLHPRCVVDWTHHLAGDQREAELATGEPVHWHQRAARAALEPVYRAERERGVTLPLRSFKGEATLLDE
jgi:hypothetical protein